MNHRYLCLNTAVRANQIEAAPGLDLGVDERGENTPENVRRFREAVEDGFPGGHVTWALSHAALFLKERNFSDVRKLIREYCLKYGDEMTYLPGGYFANAYSPRAEVSRCIHAALVQIERVMGVGYRPKAVVAGFLSAANQRFLAENEGIHVCQGNIFSQYAVDNQDGEGSLCYPYYPSREHFCKPAGGREDFVDCVCLDGWSMDLLSARHAGEGSGYNSRMGFGPIETVRPYGEKRGVELMLSAIGQYFGEGLYYNKFGYAATNWEVCLGARGGHHRMDGCERALTELLRGVRKTWPDAELVTAGEFGECFRSVYPDNSNLDYRFHRAGIGVGGSEAGKEIFWYMNGLFRLAVLREGGDPATDLVIDFTDYTKPACEPEDADWRTGRVVRNWSLWGDINQKGLRPQDGPVPLASLPAAARALIRSRYPELS